MANRHPSLKAKHEEDPRGIHSQAEDLSKKMMDDYHKSGETWHEQMVKATPLDLISAQNRAAKRFSDLNKCFDEYADWRDAPLPEPLRNFRK